MRSAASLRVEIEHSLERRFPAALSPAQRTRPEVVPTGVDEVDEVLGGGLQVGAISEVTGPECSGRTSLALTFLGRRTQEGHVCAWVDVEDALDPESAAANGVCLKQMLWVRCGDERRRPKNEGKPWGRLDQALRATDLLLQAGGFSAIVLDMGGTAAEYARRIPLATWFRFRQGAQRTRCSLVVIAQRACAQSSADVVLECKTARPQANSPTVLAGLTYEVRRERARGWFDGEQRLQRRIEGCSSGAIAPQVESRNWHGRKVAPSADCDGMQEQWLRRRSECNTSGNEIAVPSCGSLPGLKSRPTAELFPTKILSIEPTRRLPASERKPPVSTWSAACAWDVEKRA